jgi:predicted nucleic acid-binding Zn ribbon protein
MPTFLYRCPNTGKNVQGWIADDPATFSDDSYQAVTCLACTRIHLVNPKTGKLAADDDK